MDVETPAEVPAVAPTALKDPPAVVPTAPVAGVPTADIPDDVRQQHEKEMAEYNRALENYRTKVKTQPWLSPPTTPLPLEQRMLTASQRKKVRAAARKDKNESHLHRDGYGSDDDYPAHYDPSEDLYTEAEIDDMECDFDLDRKPHKHNYLKQRSAYNIFKAAATPASSDNVDDTTNAPNEPGEVKDDHSYVMENDSEYVLDKSLKNDARQDDLSHNV
jgi:hypothetical protein